MYFSNFLTIDKQSSSIRLQIPQGSKQFYFCSAVELSARGVEQIFGKINKLTEDVGILISQPLNQAGCHLLYLQPSLQIEDKYRSFLQKVITSLSGCIFFGQKINYHRLSKKPTISVDTSQQLSFFVSQRSDRQCQIYRIKNLEDNRLELGTKAPLQSIKASALSIQPKHKQLTLQWLSQLQWQLNSHQSFQNYTNLNDVQNSINKVIQMKKQLSQFHQNILRTTHQFQSKSQISRLVSAAQSICRRHTKSSILTHRVLEQFKKQLQASNKSLMSSLTQKISTYYSSMDYSSYKQLLDLLTNSKIIACQLAQYLDDSQTIAENILYHIFKDKVTILIQSLTQQLYNQKQTKRCLTQEIYQQIKTSEQLRQSLEKAEQRLSQLDDFDKKMQEMKEQLECTTSNSKQLEIELQCMTQYKEELERRLKEAIKAFNQIDQENQQITLKLDDQCEKTRNLEQKNQQLTTSLKINQQNLDKIHDQLEIISQNLTLSHSDNSNLVNMINHYKSTMNGIQKHFKDLRQADINRVNYALKTNVDIYRKTKSKVDQLQHQKCQLLEERKKLQKTIDDYRNRLVYYQKLYKMRASPSQERLSASTLMQRVNYSISDMVIFQQNDEQDTTDRLAERKRQENHTFQYSSSIQNEIAIQRKSQGCVQARKRSDWDNSSARLSQHKVQQCNTEQNNNVRHYF